MTNYRAILVYSEYKVTWATAEGYEARRLTIGKWAESSRVRVNRRASSDVIYVLAAKFARETVLVSCLFCTTMILTFERLETL